MKKTGVGKIFLTVASLAFSCWANADQTYQIEITNLTASDLTLSYDGGDCIGKHGDASMDIRPGETSPIIHLTDVNGFFTDCSDKTKSAEWIAEFADPMKYVNLSFSRTRHDGMWWTTVSGGARNVRFTATCGGDECDMDDGKAGDDPGAIRVGIGP